MISLRNDTSAGTTNRSSTFLTTLSIDIHWEVGSLNLASISEGRGSENLKRLKEMGEENSMIALINFEGGRSTWSALSIPSGK